MVPLPVTFDPLSGYFQRDGRRFIPFGVNYWPASAGVNMWKVWPPMEINRDLDLMVSLGLNTVRFFLRWEDFEPEPGNYNQAAFMHLENLMLSIAQRGLYAHPSLFVGWMSGGVFWPEWVRGRNIFSDPELVERAELFTQRTVEILDFFKTGILAIDQGNELCCLPESAAASPSQVRTWCERINRAIRSRLPNAVILSGNEQNQLVSDVGWRLGDQPGTDLYSMHGYPVPNWHPVRFDGMTDPLASSLLPGYIAAVRAYGPVMLQEFGTIVTFGKEQQDQYLHALLLACWQSGANGFLYWCFRDIKAKCRPYLTNGFEGTLGLVDANGAVKPGLECFLEFGKILESLPSPDLEEIETGIYLSSQYYPRDNPECPGHSPAQQARGLSLVHYFTSRLGIPTRCVRGGGDIPPGVKTLVVAGPYLRADEAGQLGDWVSAGGKLIWHGPDPVNWGLDYIRLTGASPLDYRADLPSQTHIEGSGFRFEHYPRGLRVEVRADTAQIMARADDSLPLVLLHELGQGKVICTLPQVEETVASYSADRAQRDAWLDFYRWEFEL
jgi:hypothetical protein